MGLTAADRRHSALTPPSDWVIRFAPFIASAGTVLDLACGRGRHVRWFLARGHAVTAIDRDISGLADIHSPQLTALQADLEAGESWPLPNRVFDAIVVTNYLYRPLFQVIMRALAPNGVLIYETFAKGNERFGRPRNPDFLLDRGELLEVVRGHLTVIGYEDLTVAQPAPACVQRICAVYSAAADNTGMGGA